MQGCFAEWKHFVANNKRTDRLFKMIRNSNSSVQHRLGHLALLASTNPNAEIAYTALLKRVVLKEWYNIMLHLKFHNLKNGLRLCDDMATTSRHSLLGLRQEVVLKRQETVRLMESLQRVLNMFNSKRISF